MILDSFKEEEPGGAAQGGSEAQKSDGAAQRVCGAQEPGGAAQVKEQSLRAVHMLPLAVATSIDALAAGVSLALLRTNIFIAILFIGVTAFVLSVLGVRLGGLFGAKYKSKAELAGGIALILLALWMLFSGF